MCLIEIQPCKPLVCSPTLSSTVCVCIQTVLKQVVALCFHTLVFSPQSRQRLLFHFLSFSFALLHTPPLNPTLNTDFPQGLQMLWSRFLSYSWAQVEFCLQLALCWGEVRVAPSCMWSLWGADRITEWFCLEETFRIFKPNHNHSTARLPRC